MNFAAEFGPEDCPKNDEGIAQPDFLAFVVGTAVIADRRFIDAGVPPRELHGQFGVDAEAVALDWNRFGEPGAESLIAGFHVG